MLIRTKGKRGVGGLGVDVDWTAREEDWAEGRETAQRAAGTHVLGRASRRSLPGVLHPGGRCSWRGEAGGTNGMA